MRHFLENHLLGYRYRRFWVYRTYRHFGCIGLAVNNCNNTRQ